MDVLPGSSGMDAQAAVVPEAGMLQQGDPASAAVAGVAEVHVQQQQQQQAAGTEGVDAMLLQQQQDVQQGVKRKAGE
jgi:hypothetical protein